MWGRRLMTLAGDARPSRVTEEISRRHRSHFKFHDQYLAQKSSWSIPRGWTSSSTVSTSHSQPHSVPSSHPLPAPPPPLGLGRSWKKSFQKHLPSFNLIFCSSGTLSSKKLLRSPRHEQLKWNHFGSIERNIPRRNENPQPILGELVMSNH